MKYESDKRKFQTSTGEGIMIFFFLGLIGLAIIGFWFGYTPEDLGELLQYLPFARAEDMAGGEDVIKNSEHCPHSDLGIKYNNEDQNTISSNDKKTRLKHPDH